MTNDDKQQLGKTLWAIADQLRGAMNADDFRDYMLAFLFLRYLSDNYEDAAKRELGPDYPENKGAAATPLARWYVANAADVPAFEKLMRRKVHYVIEPAYLWGAIAELARTQADELLGTLQDGFKYIEERSFERAFGGLFSELNLASESSVGTTQHAMHGSPGSSRRLPKGWPRLPPTAIPWAMPTNT
jgi:type I restriction enzyme M protein